MVRHSLIVGNWKLNKTQAEATALVEQVGRGLAARAVAAEVVVAPPYTALAAVAAAIRGTPIGLAAQELYPEDAGAFTGAISGPLLRDAGCTYVLVGHSERRHLFGESLASSAARVQAALRAQLTPILCVGETLSEREAEATDQVVGQQLQAALVDVSAAQLACMVVAYEPVWAIGTGRVASPEQAQAVHGHLRLLLTQHAASAGPAVRLLYGGSVKPDNAASLLQQPDIDGALVGGASLDAAAFLAIAVAAG